MITSSNFRPAWWLPGPHLQTLWPQLRRQGPQRLRRERLELPDGDFLDLHWRDGAEGPTVLLLHGLEGSAASPYIRGQLEALAAAGLRGVVMHFRGCSAEPNRLPRAYHSGDTADLDRVVTHLCGKGETPLPAVIGFSLGANVLLKWLGQQGSAAPVAAAVAVSVPFRLADAAARLERGFSRLYQWVLLRQLRRKFSTRPHRPLPPQALARLRTFRAFDDAVTAPLHGFADVDDYYTRSSCRPFLPRIAVPTLILHAADDPFLEPAAIPGDDELSPTTLLELSAAGGHVGFIEGAPWRPRYWLERRIPRFLLDQLRR